MATTEELLQTMKLAEEACNMSKRNNYVTSEIEWCSTADWVSVEEKAKTYHSSLLGLWNWHPRRTVSLRGRLPTIGLLMSWWRYSKALARALSIYCRRWRTWRTDYQHPGWWTYWPGTKDGWLPRSHRADHSQTLHVTWQRCHFPDGTENCEKRSVNCELATKLSPS